MHIVLTGGTGLIGRALCARLLDAGHTLSVLTRAPRRAAALLPPEVRLQAWDARSPGGWARLLDGADGVVNLAGESIAGESLPAILTRRWTAETKERIRQSRLRAGRALVDAIRQAARRPRVLVQASAVGYYGDASARAVDESAPPGDDFLARVCVEWEASTAEVEALGVRRAVIRTGLVLAPEGGILPMLLLPVQFFVGGPLGSGEQAIPWIHIADETEAIRFLLERDDAAGAYNLCAPQPLSQAEFVRRAARLLRRPTFFSAPAPLLRLALGEKAALVLEGQRAVPRRLLDAGFRFRYENLEAALRDLLGAPA